ncbi:MAG: universal stress protein, partial [Pseudomonadales bacterium]
MHELKHVLVVVNRSDDAKYVLEKAQLLSSAARATAHVIRVIYDDIVASKIPQGEDAQRLKTFIMEAEETFLEELVDGFRVEFENIETATIWNKKDWEGVIDVARDLGIDLIIKAANVESRLQEVIHTPDDWNILRHATCPVMLVKAQAWVSEPAIIAAVNVLDDEHEALNRHILAYARDLTRILGGELHLVNAFPLFEPWIGELGAAYDYVSIKREVEAEVDRRVRSIADEVEVDYRLLHIREGKAELVIRDLCEETNAELVVMGTAARSGVRGIVIGNTSEALLHVVNTDVLTLHDTEEAA